MIRDKTGNIDISEFYKSLNENKDYGIISLIDLYQELLVICGDVDKNDIYYLINAMNMYNNTYIDYNLFISFFLVTKSQLSYYLIYS